MVTVWALSSCKIISLGVLGVGWKSIPSSGSYCGLSSSCGIPSCSTCIALGLACGVLASFTPLFGFHFLVGALLAFLARANILASILGTFCGNPLTFPLMAAISVRVGDFILDDRVAEFENNKDSSDSWVRESDLTSFEVIKEFILEVYSDKFVPYAVGGVLCGFLAAITVYVISRPLIITYQRRKRRRNL